MVLQQDGLRHIDCGGKQVCSARHVVSSFKRRHYGIGLRLYIRLVEYLLSRIPCLLLWSNMSRDPMDANKDDSTALVSRSQI